MKELDVYTPSNALLQALEDLEKVEKLDNYKVNMDNWCELEWSGKPEKLTESGASAICFVCFAGSVMTQRLTDGHDFDICPNSFEQPVRDTLNALDSIRSYSYEEFLDNFYGDSIGYGQTKEILLTALSKFKFCSWEDDYKSDPKKFKRNMRKIAKTLQEYGC